MQSREFASPSESGSIVPQRVCRGSIVGMAVLAILAWIGWVTGWRVLASGREMYIPTSPNTALCFFLFAVALGFASWSGPQRLRLHWLPLASAAVAGLVPLARLVEFATSFDLSVDRWFFQAPTGNFGLAPVGKMSLFSAILFAVASPSVVLLLRNPAGRVARDAAGGIGLLVIAVAAIFLLGYLFDAPLLYGGKTIPMALNTAVAFVLLGTAIIAEAGPGAFPLRPLRGPSVHARLLREFLPFVVGTVFLDAWLVHLVTLNVGDSAVAILSALAAVLAMLVAALLCGRTARRVGSQIERAELALMKAQEELEGRVAERTRELRQAKELLEERNRQLLESASELERTAASERQAHQELQGAHHELKRAESQLVQSETLSAIGKMVAGVAHEINNPLAFVTNNVAILQRDVGHIQQILALYREAEATPAEHQCVLFDRIRDLAEQIDLTYVLDHLNRTMVQSRDGLKRIQQIVKGLRDFARIDESEIKEVDLNAGIATTVEIMRPLAIQQRVALEMELEPLPLVTCFAAKINQVVLNLVANAIDASPPGSLVTVRSCPEPRAQGVLIDVIDEGCGIDPAIRDRIFDPFFTTKPVGKGTGLGLSISYGIVQSHGGRIFVESTPGKGTTFAIVLPCHSSVPLGPRSVTSRDGNGQRDGLGTQRFDQLDSADESPKRAATNPGGVG